MGGFLQARHGSFVRRGTLPGRVFGFGGDRIAPAGSGGSRGPRARALHAGGGARGRRRDGGGAWVAGRPGRTGLRSPRPGARPFARQLQLARTNGDRRPRRCGRRRREADAGGRGEAGHPAASLRSIPLRADGTGEALAEGNPEGRRLRTAAQSGGDQRRSQTEFGSQPHTPAPSRTGQPASPLGGMRGGDAAARGDPLRRARTGKGPAGVDQADFQRHAGLWRRGCAESGTGAGGSERRVSDFSGKVVLITGGSRGIGRACAVAFADLGAQVVIGYAGNEAAANETLALLKTKGRALRFDVADAAACAKALDGLVLRTKEEDWDRQLDTNLKGAFALIRAAARPMMKQRAGAIVNLTSVVGETGNAGQSAYSASKAGLIGLTKSVARELASRNIRVNAVSPGLIETDMTARISGETRTKMVEEIPLSRLGAASEIAHAVVFLASDEASYITGEVLRVNGGMYM